MIFSKVLKSVNDPSLAKEITDFVEEGMNELRFDWSSAAQRDSFIGILEDYIQDVGFGKDSPTMDQFKIICDKRNNKTLDTTNGKYHLDIEYKQRNCFNVTKIMYTIKLSQGPSMNMDPPF